MNNKITKEELVHTLQEYEQAIDKVRYLYSSLMNISLINPYKKLPKVGDKVQILLYKKSLQIMIMHIGTVESFLKNGLMIARTLRSTRFYNYISFNSIIGWSLYHE